MKKENWVLIILAAVIIFLIAILLLPSSNPNNVGVQIPENTLKILPPQNQQVEGIQVLSPMASGQISSPLKITGTVNNGGWGGFEGQVGTVQLLDNKGNKLAAGILKATTDWTKPPVSFESSLIFAAKISGPATLFFSNENPSGDPAKVKNFGLPVVIK